MGRARLNAPTLGGARGLALAWALLGAALAAGCEDFPARSAPLEARVPAMELSPSDLVAGAARFTYYDYHGSPQIVLDAAAIPPEARHAVRVHLPERTAVVLPRAVAYAADLTQATPRLVAQPVDRIRAGSYAPQAGLWAGRAIAETARVWAEVHPGSDASRAAIEARRRFAAHVDPLEHEGLDPRRLDVQRRMRTIAAARPRPQDFGLVHEIGRAVLFVRADCEPCAQAIASHPKARVWSVEKDYAAEALGFLSAAAGVDPAVPTLWQGTSLRQGVALRAPPSSNPSE